MFTFKMIAAAALALPAVAIAQVGPNPAVSGGSLDPTVGAARDTDTAPMGNSPSMSTRSNAGMMNNGSTGMTGSSETSTTTTGTADTSVDRAASVGSGDATATTSARAGTRAEKSKMGKHRKPR